MMVSAQGPIYRRGAMAMAPHLGRQAVADLENFGGGDDKIYEHELCIISKFWMFMINVLGDIL